MRRSIVRAAAAADLDTVSDLVVRAFAGHDVAEWALPPDVARTICGHALEHGGVDLIDRRGALVWFSHEHGTPPPPAYDDPAVAAACGALGALRPYGTRHAHVALIAVDPANQGRGLGSALLGHRHRQFDARRLPSYLEASSIRIRAFCQRAAYRDSAPPFRLGDGPWTWPMWREPVIQGRPA